MTRSLLYLMVATVFVLYLAVIENPSEVDEQSHIFLTIIIDNLESAEMNNRVIRQCHSFSNLSTSSCLPPSCAPQESYHQLTPISVVISSHLCCVYVRKRARHVARKHLVRVTV